MKNKASAISLFGISTLLLCFMLFDSLSMAQKIMQKKLYISSIKAEGLPKQVAKDARNRLEVSIYENFKDYRVLTDDDVKAMFKKAEEIMASGCNAESCQQQIADAVDADEIIYGELAQSGPEISFIGKNLVRDRKTLTVDKKSMVSLKFPESQLDHYMGEIAKKLIEPKYEIKKGAVTDFTRASLADIKVEKVKDFGGIKDVKGLGIEILRFTTTDETLQSILLALKDGVKKGDDYFQNRKYENAAQEYHAVLKKIQTRITPEKQQKLNEFAAEIQKRAEAGYTMKYKTLSEKGDSVFKEGDYKKARVQFAKIREDIAENVAPEYKIALAEVDEGLKRRAEATWVMQYKNEIEALDAKFKAVKEADLSFLEKMCEKYRDIERSFTEVPRDIWGTGMESIKNSIAERQDSMTIAMAGLHEKKGGVNYRENKFVDASKSYETAKKLTLSIMDENKKNEYLKHYAELIYTTIATGENYLASRVRSLADRAEYFNIKDEFSVAKKALNEARDLIVESMSMFATENSVTVYNNTASVIGTKPVTRGNAEHIFARIDDAKIAEERRLEELALIEEAQRQKAYNDEMRKKGFFVIKDIGGIKFVKLPFGSFMMGSPNGYGDNDEHPQTKVTLNSFWMGKTEITQKQYQNIIGTNPSKFKGDNLPVDGVNWADAIEFCKIYSKKYNVNARLPYEAEWEYGCRAGTTTSYYWGNEIDDNYCWYVKNSDRTTHLAGHKRPNPWGLFDMSGNVWEWCADWYSEDYYRNRKEKIPTGPYTGKHRVLRGGSWDDESNDLRSGLRGGDKPDNRSINYGFRIVISEP